MGKRKTPSKPASLARKSATLSQKGGRQRSAEYQKPVDLPVVEEAVPFRVVVGGRKKHYAIQSGFGYFIPSLRRAENLVEVNELVESGIPSKEVEPIIEYLDLKITEVARAASVSPSTVSRWKDDTSIGVAGSNQFFRIDEIIRKGVGLFGGLEQFKAWLLNPNLALGNAVPARLITSLIGVEMVEEALDALHFGNVM